jgi:hypothetical protein
MWRFQNKVVNRQLSVIKLIPSASALAMILGVCLLLMVLGLGMGFLSYSENYTSYSYLNAQEAYLAAQSGIYDGLYRISLNKDYENPMGYSLAVGGGSVTITVDKDNPQTGFSLIRAEAIVRKARKVHEAKVVIDATTGQSAIVSWQEKSI